LEEGLRCPVCGEILRGRFERYGVVYVCEACGVIIIKVKRYGGV